MGPEMMQKLRDQAERFGARLLTEQVDRVELSNERAAYTRYGWVTPSTAHARWCWRWARSTRSCAFPVRMS